ncbi:hypothetical protein BWI15_03850 [Kribbella sp. ALI-6-A]|uniref:hypothetical protein n=1 Tax=Kribbella sp. ALI-6-A TaxID=1933817 RepID=UPI00097BC1B0|nr:hypothetical protein [Kribbella sp. ALI-6-A]ONI77646.1 hypothetical protein BWI15_03850 [Kribbella sp. ALI-6-A]
MPHQAPLDTSVITSTQQYEDALRTVEQLRAYGMTGLEITGAGLRMVDRRTGDVARASGLSALTGAALGLALGVFVTLVAETSMTGLAVVFWGLVYGAILGALVGFFKALVRNRPEAATTEVHPTEYEVRCAPADVVVAKKLLATPPDLHHQQAA